MSDINVGSWLLDRPGVSTARIDRSCVQGFGFPTCPHPAPEVCTQRCALACYLDAIKVRVAAEPDPRDLVELRNRIAEPGGRATAPTKRHGPPLDRGPAAAPSAAR